MLLDPNYTFFALAGRLCSGPFCVILTTCFTQLGGHDTLIDFLWFLFLVGMISPLMQEHFL